MCKLSAPVKKSKRRFQYLKGNDVSDSANEKAHAFWTVKITRTGMQAFGVVIGGVLVLKLIGWIG